MAGSDEEIDRSQLLQWLLAQFSDGELRTLCFELGVEYEDLGGRGRAENARELIALLERRGRLPELIARFRKRRQPTQRPPHEDPQVVARYLDVVRTFLLEVTLKAE